jgi:hypothetical protein
MRKFALLAVVAIAAMAMAATTASAATQVRDANGVLCPPVVPAIDHSTTQKAVEAYLNPNPATYQSGGCTARMVSTGSTTNRSFYNESCHISYTLHIGPDGWGYANQFNYSSCLGGPWTPSATRVVGPVEANYGLFTSGNANTDFNTYWRATRFSSQVASGGLSLDVTALSPMRIANQRLTGDFSKGAWQSLDPILIITH